MPPKRMSFADLVVSGKRGLGGCSPWTNLIGDDIPNTLISYTPHTLVFASTNNLDDSIVDSEIVCKETGVPSAIVQYLASLTSTLTGSNKTFTCGGVVWHVGMCDSATTPYICANCSASSMCQSSIINDPYAIGCFSNGSSRYDSLQVLTIDFEDISVAPVILSISVTGNSESLEVDYSVSEGVGSIVCAAFKSPGAPPLSVDSLLVDGHLSPLNGNTGAYIISGLTPSTSYDVYCATMSSLDAPMKLDLILNTKVVQTTACCRSVSVNLLRSSVLDSQDVANIVQVAIDIPPSTALTAEIRLLNEMGVSLPDVFMPQRVSFGPSINLRGALSSYLKSSPGSYTLNVTLSGPAASSYVVSYPRGRQFSIINSIQEPVAPRLLSAEFSNDGTSIIVLFTSSTNRAGYTNSFQCSAVFAFSLSSNIMCIWITDSSARILSAGSAGAGGSIKIGDRIILKNGVLKAKCIEPTSGVLAVSCRNWTFSSRNNVTVQAPATPILPQVSVIAPSQIGPCDSLVVDVTGSRGSGGRPFVSCSLLVSSLDPAVSNLQTFLNGITTFDQPISLTAEYLTPGYAYSLVVKLCSFLGACGISTHRFAVSSSPNIPIVAIFASKLSVSKRFATLRIAGNAYISSCNGGKSRTLLDYTWLVSENGIPIGVQSVSTDKTIMLLPPYTLSVGKLYTVTLTAQHTISWKKSSATVAVFIESGEVLAYVVGSSYRGLPSDGMVTIDASASYDEDDPDNVDTLVFIFTCIQIHPSINLNCPLTLQNVPGAPWSVQASVPAHNRDSLIGSIHKVTVDVAQKTDDRFAQTFVEVEVLPLLAPIVTLKAANGIRINPSEKLKILGTLETNSSVTAQWSVDDNSVDLYSIALSAVSQTFSISTKSDSNSFNGKATFLFSLVLPAFTLSEDSTFTFSLQCVDASGYSSTAALAIFTNSPPSMGSYDVSPSSGVKLLTDFLCTALQFEDVDIPLTYEFSYQGPASTFSVHRARAALPFAGLEQLGFKLMTRLRVFDSLDAEREGLASVVVEAGEKLKVSDVKEYFNVGVVNASGYAGTERLSHLLFII